MFVRIKVYIVSIAYDSAKKTKYPRLIQHMFFVFSGAPATIISL